MAEVVAALRIAEVAAALRPQPVGSGSETAALCLRRGLVAFASAVVAETRDALLVRRALVHVARRCLRTWRASTERRRIGRDLCRLELSILHQPTSPSHASHAAARRVAEAFEWWRLTLRGAAAFAYSLTVARLRPEFAPSSFDLALGRLHARQRALRTALGTWRHGVSIWARLQTVAPGPAWRVRLAGALRLLVARTRAGCARARMRPLLAAARRERLCVRARLCLASWRTARAAGAQLRAICGELKLQRQRRALRRCVAWWQLSPALQGASTEVTQLLRVGRLQHAFHRLRANEHRRRYRGVVAARAARAHAVRMSGLVLAQLSGASSRVAHYDRLALTALRTTHRRRLRTALARLRTSLCVRQIDRRRWEVAHLLRARAVLLAWRAGGRRRDERQRHEACSQAVRLTSLTAARTRCLRLWVHFCSAARQDRAETWHVHLRWVRAAWSRWRQLTIRRAALEMGAYERRALARMRWHTRHLCLVMATWRLWAMSDRTNAALRATQRHLRLQRAVASWAVHTAAAGGIGGIADGRSGAPALHARARRSRLTNSWMRWRRLGCHPLTVEGMYLRARRCLLTEAMARWHAHHVTAADIATALDATIRHGRMRVRGALRDWRRGAALEMSAQRRLVSRAHGRALAQLMRRWRGWAAGRRTQATHLLVASRLGAYRLTQLRRSQRRHALSLWLDRARIAAALQRQAPRTSCESAARRRAHEACHARLTRWCALCRMQRARLAVDGAIERRYTAGRTDAWAHWSARTASLARHSRWQRTRVRRLLESGWASWRTQCAIAAVMHAASAALQRARARRGEGHGWARLQQSCESRHRLARMARTARTTHSTRCLAAGVRAWRSRSEREQWQRGLTGKLMAARHRHHQVRSLHAWHERSQWLSGGVRMRHVANARGNAQQLASAVESWRTRCAALHTTALRRPHGLIDMPDAPSGAPPAARATMGVPTPTPLAPPHATPLASQRLGRAACSRPLEWYMLGRWQRRAAGALAKSLAERTQLTIALQHAMARRLLVWHTRGSFVAWCRYAHALAHSSWGMRRLACAWRTWVHGNVATRAAFCRAEAANAWSGTRSQLRSLSAWIVARLRRESQRAAMHRARAFYGRPARLAPPMAAWSTHVRRRAAAHRGDARAGQFALAHRLARWRVRAWQSARAVAMQRRQEERLLRRLVASSGGARRPTFQSAWEAAGGRRDGRCDDSSSMLLGMSQSLHRLGSALRVWRRRSRSAACAPVASVWAVRRTRGRAWRALHDTACERRRRRGLADTHLRLRRARAMRAAALGWCACAHRLRSARATDRAMARAASEWVLLARFAAWAHHSRRNALLSQRVARAAAATAQSTFSRAMCSWRARARRVASREEQRARRRVLDCRGALMRWRHDYAGAAGMPLLMAGVARRALCAVLIRGVQRRMHALQLASWLRYGDAATLASVSALSTLRLWAHAIRRALDGASAIGVRRSHTDDGEEPMLSIHALFRAVHAMQRQRVVALALAAARCAGAFANWRRRWMLSLWEQRLLHEAEQRSGGRGSVVVPFTTCRLARATPECTSSPSDLPHPLPGSDADDATGHGDDGASSASPPLPSLSPSSLGPSSCWLAGATPATSMATRCIEVKPVVLAMPGARAQGV